MSELEIINCEQGTDLWRLARSGVITASEFDSVMASGKGGAPSKTRRTYMLKLAGEILTGEPAESYSNIHMERGKIMEAEARDAYCLLTDNECQQVGFLKRGDVGASPDSLIGDDGMLEIKTKLPHLQLEVLLDGELPSEHKAQVQGQLWVSGRQWVDFVSYWPKLRPFIKRVYRDEKYIDTLKVAVDQFRDDLKSMLDKIKEMK